MEHRIYTSEQSTSSPYGVGNAELHSTPCSVFNSRLVEPLITSSFVFKHAKESKSLSGLRFLDACNSHIGYPFLGFLHLSQIDCKLSSFTTYHLVQGGQ